eukprot:Hpha_TRINITY_DN2230_c0_g1::TRINITY_DN2230_c0_g1_i1::g.25418::m.25418
MPGDGDEGEAEVSQFTALAQVARTYLGCRKPAEAQSVAAEIAAVATGARPGCQLDCPFRPVATWSALSTAVGPEVRGVVLRPKGVGEWAADEAVAPLWVSMSRVREVAEGGELGVVGLGTRAGLLDAAAAEAILRRCRASARQVLRQLGSTKAVEPTVVVTSDVAVLPTLTGLLLGYPFLWCATGTGVMASS